MHTQQTFQQFLNFRHGAVTVILQIAALTPA